MNIFNDIPVTDVDVVISSVPLTVTDMPIMAPAVLKSIAIQAGKTCAAIDINASVLKWVEGHTHKTKLLDFFHNGTFHSEIADELFGLHYSIAKLLLSYNPKIVGLSLLSYACQQSNKYLCYFIKKLDPSVQIIIGGTGCFDALRGVATYADELKSSGLIDAYIRGDGEKAFAAFLNGSTSYPGINNDLWEEISRDELDRFPYPNFDDYVLDLHDVKSIPILGSRGCVRKCTFCDIIEYWKKFNFRSGQSIFNEMLEQNRRYNVRHFKFHDSLINGNMKEYKILVQLLADHNQQNPNNSFSWASYFIIRPQSTFDEELWHLTALSGAKVLNVGIESLSEHIRTHMGKKFSNADLEFALQMGKKYKLHFVCLMIVGYITETQADIDYAVDWWTSHTEYNDMLTVQFGGTLGIMPNTWLDRNKKMFDIVVDGPLYQNWTNASINSTPQLRAKWNQHLFDLCKRLGYKLLDNIDNHYVLEMMLRGSV